VPNDKVGRFFGTRCIYNCMFFFHKSEHQRQCLCWQAFVAYLKSVMMASNKKVFDVTQINLDDFARLIRLSFHSVYTNTVEHCVACCMLW